RGDAVNLNSKVMDARPLARRLRLGRLGAGVVLDQRHIEYAVAQMARRVVAHLLGVHLHEAEDLLVELGGALQALVLQREMQDSAHHSSFSSGLSLRTLPSLSRFQTASHRRRARVLPKTGAMRS